MKKLYGHNSPETAYSVENYPYGFRLKTTKRYWVESVAKKGDRYITQTINPKNGLWNKPKKSTYSPVVIMLLNEDNHVKYSSLSTFDGAELLEEKIKNIDVERLNDLQKYQIKWLRAYHKTMENVTFTMEVEKFRHKVTGEIITEVPIFEMSEYEKVNPKDEQKEQATMASINRNFAYNLSNESEV